MWSKISYWIRNKKVSKNELLMLYRVLINFCKTRELNKEEHIFCLISNFQLEINFPRRQYSRVYNSTIPLLKVTRRFNKVLGDEWWVYSTTIAVTDSEDIAKKRALFVQVEIQTFYNSEPDFWHISFEMSVWNTKKSNWQYSYNYSSLKVPLDLISINFLLFSPCYRLAIVR